jgi:Uma2 family endonuclease
MLLQEVEVWTSATQWRKPDMAYFTQAQIRIAADKTNAIPEFVIEVISIFDPINVVTTKVIEYFKAGVKVLWHIFPEQKMVYVFHSAKHIEVFEAEELCSAAPVLPTFVLSVNDIFKLI